jgi:cytochrome b561
MVDIPGFTPTKLKYFSWHKWLGVTVLGLAAIRVLWRKANRRRRRWSRSAWQHKIADGMHYLLYLLIFAVPSPATSTPTRPACRWSTWACGKCRP